MQPTILDLMGILSPSAPQFTALLALLAVTAGFVMIGAALSGRNGGLPEANLLAGWSVSAALFTVGGGLLNISLSHLAIVLSLLTAVSALVLWRRNQAPLDRGTMLVLAWTLPVLFVTASMQPSQWDEFSQWLPNARYLVMFDAFPGAGHPVSDSVFPAYPHGVALVSYLASCVAGRFAEGVAPWFNLFLLVCSGRLMIRLFRSDDCVPVAAGAWGLLAVTALATTFVPKLVLSAYADTATAVAVGFSAVLGLRVIEPNRKDWGAAVQLAAIFALLPMTKQGNFSLMGLLLAGLGLEILRQKGALRRRLPVLIACLIPAVAVAVAWRAHVVSGVGEMSIRSISGWEWALLPKMLRSMGGVIASKGGYFGLGIAICAFVIFGRKTNPAQSQAHHAARRLASLFAVLFVGYILFLLFVYLAILSGYESATAASFWRYNTHLGMAEMFAAAALAGAAWASRPKSEKLTRGLGVLAAMLVVVGPLAALPHIRFDRQPVKVHVRQVIDDMATYLPPDARLMVLDPRGTGFYANYVEYYLGFGRQVAGSVSVFSPPDMEAQMAQARPDHLWVHTQVPAMAGLLGQSLDAKASHLLALQGTQWRLVKSWPFPGYDDPTAVKD